MGHRSSVLGSLGHRSNRDLSLALRRELVAAALTRPVAESMGHRSSVLGSLGHRSNRETQADIGLRGGLRWHQALSAEAARTYKPAPEVYRLAAEIAARPLERLVMVAAHAWDLRGAQALGMRTAYVHRPVGDPPTASDRFDWQVPNLSELADHLHDAAG
jgi:beta-phosphoglucomutase-like phosphatase (HAD superfamily)